MKLIMRQFLMTQQQIYLLSQIFILLSMGRSVDVYGKGLNQFDFHFDLNNPVSEIIKFFLLTNATVS